MRSDVQLEFADGEYTFRLTLSGIDEIQRKCGAGMGEVYARVLAGRFFSPVEEGVTIGNPLEGKWRVEDLLEIIRQGLIGGGQGMVDGRPVEVNSVLANRLVENYVVTQPLKFAWDLASAIVMAANEGLEARLHSVKKKRGSGSVSRATDGSTTRERSRTSQSATSAPSKQVS